MSASHENLRGLRLTLRTLLAWMDDTLGPEEVRNIGRQVAESPVATELVDRIKHVTRRRRLGVPPSTGPDATDPNLVASYLDNELDADRITEFEKLCLRSNAHLAEVASSHQILSLIGQKAKVPTATRQRMYRLVRGREAVRRKVPATVANPELSLSAVGSPPGNGSGTTEVWSPEMTPRGSILSRLALPLAALALIALMAASAWMLAPPAGRGPSVATTAPAAPAEVVPPLPPPPAAVAAQPVAPEPAGPEPRPDPAETETETAAAMPDRPEPVLGSLGVIANLDGPVLRWNEENRTWERVNMGEALRADRRIVAMSPFRPVLEMGGVNVEMIGGGEVIPRDYQGGEAARFVLADGRVRLLAAPDREARVAVSTGGDDVWTLTLAPGQAVGLEREGRREPGQAEPSPAGLMVASASGDVPVAHGASTFTVSGPQVVHFAAGGTSIVDPDAPVPGWVEDPTPTALERTQGRAFAEGFGPDTRTLAGLVEALESEDRGTRALALEALGSVGAYDLIVAELNREGDPELRRDAIAALRRIGGRDAASAASLRQELVRFVSPTWAEQVELLLFGLPPERARTEATMKGLVELLSHPDVSVRELAIDQLRTLTGRDALDYDADRPTGPGLKAWQDLLRAGELAPPDPEGAATREAVPPAPTSAEPGAARKAAPAGREPNRGPAR